MTKPATVYWSLCLVAATALVGGRQLVAFEANDNGSRRTLKKIK